MILRSKLPWKFAVCFLALAASAASAQDAIRWRTDYNTARKEAEAKNLPMVIDFITNSCFYCKKMDDTTFLDPRIISTSNEKFIPLKINHNVDPNLGNLLNIGLFPTIIVAGPDGRVMNKKIGYQDAESMNDLLQTALNTLAPAPRDLLQEKYFAAVKMEEAGEFLRAVSNLRDILEDGKPRVISKDAQALLNKIEKRATDKLNQAKEMHANGQHAEALEAYTEILRTFPSLTAGREASDLITKMAAARPEVNSNQRKKLAREWINQAKDFYKSNDYIPCLYFCDKILDNYADLPEGQEAHLLASKIKNNPDWLQSAADVTADRLGSLYLALADTHLKRGEVRVARHWLERVMATFPGSRLAESAQLRLTQIQGTVPAGNVVPVSRPKMP